MNPADLLAPSSALGAPAPYPLLVFFKVLGFTLHMAPMNLWYAGIVLALWMQMRGSEPGRIWAARLMNQMPLFIALGINFGVVPLLFLQVSYYRAFYPATILMAWPWLSIIGLLTLAYYGVYAYVIGMRSGRLPRWRRAAGWLAAGLFIVIGFLFANGMSLMTNLSDWPQLWQHGQIGGAVLGTALNTGDPTLWPRWLLVIGLALGTTAVHAVVDSGIFAGRDADAYRRWAAGFAVKLYAAGWLWFELAGAWYVFGTWGADVRTRMFGSSLWPLTLLAAATPGVVLLLIVVQRQGVTRRLAWATGAAQFLVLGCNAIARQVVQNLELARWYNVTADPVRTQWSPLLLFFVFFLAGVGVLTWMVRQLVNATRRRPDAESRPRSEPESEPAGV
jgi:hypothetical protein